MLFEAYDTEKAFGVRFGSHSQLNVLCPFHNDDKQSCSVSDVGLFKCHACGAKGNAAQFYARTMGISVSDAEKALRVGSVAGGTERELSPIQKLYSRKHNTAKGVPLSEAQVYRCHQHLLANPRRLAYLTQTRGLSLETLKKYQIGCDEYRFTIPVRDYDGKLRNIRRYLPNSGTMPKMVSHAAGDGTPRIYPGQEIPELIPGTETILCEGEWDRLLLWQHGFRSAFTNTGNVSTWAYEWTDLFVRQRMVIIFDVNDHLDDLGQRMAQLRAQDLFHRGSRHIQVVRLPLSGAGEDITDWFQTYKRNAAELRELIDATPLWEPTEATRAQIAVAIVPHVEDPAAPYQVEMPRMMQNPSTASSAPRGGMQDGISSRPPTDSAAASGNDATVPYISLNEAAHAKYFYKPVRMRCLVAGKGMAPYLAPMKMKVQVYHTPSAPTEHLIELNVWDDFLLSLIRCSQGAQKRLVRSRLGVDNDVRITIEVLESVNVEEVYLIPTVDGDTEQGPYVMRHAYFIGMGLETNKIYDFRGYTLPDPRTQAATHMLTEAVAAETSVDTFTLTPERCLELRETFSSPDVWSKMREIAEEFSHNVTHIYGRPDVHMGIDLVYHSPLAFDFEGTRLRKGWLECLIIGDTRTGKGFVAEGLRRHYGLGNVVSGENLTMAGLIGGVQHVGDRWTLVWGQLPLSDRRLVILDECSSLSTQEIARLSRVRSEGIAEITKVVSEKTTARTRLIWLSNPRATPGAMPRMVADYGFGIECVPELIGAAEDVARFDFVIIVGQNEVEASLINKRHIPDASPKYTQSLCTDLVLWAWSRRPEDIHFPELSVDLILRASQALGRTFSPRVCLVQNEDIRFKLARIACAAAARTFSTPDGRRLVVEKEHVEFAYNFLFAIYSKPICGYQQLSFAERERGRLRDPKAIVAALGMVGQDKLTGLVEGLLENDTISVRDVANYGDVDQRLADAVVAALVRARALTKERYYYRKKPEFRDFLGTLFSRLSSEAPVTTSDIEDHTDDVDSGIESEPSPD